MVEKDNIFSGKIKHGGVFDFKEFYRFCYMWFIDKDYWLVEKEYTEKIGAGGKEVVIAWEARKKVSDYFRFLIKVDWRILGMKKVEVENQGQKIEMDKGMLEIKVSVTLEKDYEAKWENHPFMKFFRGIYDKYIIAARIDSYEGKIFSESDEFLSQAKAFLALEGGH
jgi:hypothetical protein